MLQREQKSAACVSNMWSLAHKASASGACALPRQTRKGLFGVASCTWLPASCGQARSAERPLIRMSAAERGICERRTLCSSVAVVLALW